MIEILESRIAPAAVFYFTDVDGDHVKITSSKGTNAQLANAVTLSNVGTPSSPVPVVGKPHQLEMLNLTGTDNGNSIFAGASISITATPSNDLGTGIKGNGFVNVGEINAASVRLASVAVHGDLGQIIVGDGNGKSPGLGSLKVESMGDFGTTTGANATASRFANGVGSIYVAHDVNGVLLRADTTGDNLAAARIGSVFIGGNLIGGSASDTGEIAADNIGSVKIMGSVIGGSATQTGRIATNVNGNLDGGSGGTGVPAPGGTIGSIYIGGSLIGGSDQATGVIYAPENVGSVIIKGSVIGGSAITTGGIDALNLGSITIGANLAGTAFSGSSDVDHTAFVRAQGNIGAVTVGGSITPGAESGGGALTFSGAIQAGQTLGTVKVLGAIEGNSTQQVTISGVGLSLTALTSLAQKAADPAIKSLSVGESVSYALIEGGYDLNGIATSGDAQIGTVKVGGDLIASDIIAGIKSTSSQFGHSTDTVIGRPTTVSTDGILAKIASINIGGEIEGDSDSNDVFGIEAQLIGSLITGGVKLPLTAGSGFYLSETTAAPDVHVREFPVDTTA